MKIIPLSQGKVALVDDADYPTLSKFKWYAHKGTSTFYAWRNVTDSSGAQTKLVMHCEIIPDEPRIDHRDGNGLNNQRENLRPASTRQNGQNRRKLAPASSKFKGVHRRLISGVWQARIKTSDRRLHLGYFKTEVDAARAYNDAAKKHFGEFANLNDIE